MIQVPNQTQKYSDKTFIGMRLQFKGNGMKQFFTSEIL